MGFSMVAFAMHPFLSELGYFVGRVPDVILGIAAAVMILTVVLIFVKAGQRSRPSKGIGWQIAFSNVWAVVLVGVILCTSLAEGGLPSLPAAPGTTVSGTDSAVQENLSVESTDQPEGSAAPVDTQDSEEITSASPAGSSSPAQADSPTAVCVTGVSLSSTSKTLTVGQSFTLTATVSPSDASNKGVHWSSSGNSGIVSVSGSGNSVQVRANAGGKVKIIVKTSDGGYSASCAVTVNVPMAGVSLDPESKSLTTGDSFTLKANFSPPNASNTGVSWISSDPDVASVPSGGNPVTVTSHKAGTATITVKTADGGYQDSCSVNVSDPVVHVKSVKLNVSSNEDTPGASLTLTATVTPNDAADPSLTWSSSDPNIASILGSGNSITVQYTVRIPTCCNLHGMASPWQAPITYIIMVYIKGIGRVNMAYVRET